MATTKAENKELSPKLDTKSVRDLQKGIKDSLISRIRNRLEEAKHTRNRKPELIVGAGVTRMPGTIKNGGKI